MGEPLTSRDELVTQPANGDFLHVVDISDTTDSPEGTSKKIQYNTFIPDASTTVEGKVELATDAETITGTDTVRAVTPSNITAKMDTDVTLAGDSDTRIATQKATKTYVDTSIAAIPSGGGMNSLLKNGNFINNSTNGYGATPDDWTSSNANPVQGGIPALTKQNVIDILGVADGDIEILLPLNESSGNALDLSSNAYNLTDTNTVGVSSDGLMVRARDYELSSNQYHTIADASCPNLEISGSQTWIAFIKPESFSGGTNRTILSKRNTTIKQLYINGDTNPKAQFYLQGLTSNVTIASDVILEAGKWYMVVGVYDSANSLLKIWVNGVKKQLTASGSASDSNGNFQVSAYNGTNEPYDGLIQNACVLSVALTDNQVKKLFAATLYKGQKIRRATTNGYLYQQLPQDLVERLRGKTVALRADMYQEVASTAQLSIHQTMADGTTDEAIISATDATTGSWLSKVATGTLEADVVTIELRLKHSTSDGNTWFRNVSFYEGSSELPYDHSKDDWSRFPNLLKMRIPNILSGYQYEEGRLHTSPITPSMRASGSMTVSSTSFALKKFCFVGESIQNFMTVTFTNGGTAAVANYYTAPFVIDDSTITASNGRAIQVVNNAVQEVGVARVGTGNELECYRYNGSNWTLASNQTIHDATNYPLKYT